MSRMELDLNGSYLNNKSPQHGDSEGMLPRPIAFGRVPNVCIIGAGLAGLRCADILLQRGARVTIFEGRNRVGGRVSPYSTIHT